MKAIHDKTALDKAKAKVECAEKMIEEAFTEVADEKLSLKNYLDVLNLHCALKAREATKNEDQLRDAKAQSRKDARTIRSLLAGEFDIFLIFICSF